MTTTISKKQAGEIVNGLRVDLHEPDCAGMDTDGNWLGDCDCAEQEEGMPAIIWSDSAAERWINALDELGEAGRGTNSGYTVKVVTKPNPLNGEWEAYIGRVVKADRAENSSGWPRLLIRLQNHKVLYLLADEIESVYVY